MPKREPKARSTSTNAALRRLLSGGREHKYRAKATEVDGIRFASKREARRYCELKLLAQGGKIRELRRQVRYKLVRITHYVADFVYIDCTTGAEVVEDVKGYATAEYKAKRKLMAEQHDIEIREVR